MNNQQTVEHSVRDWLQSCVIDLSLCPFARTPYQAGRVRIVVCEARGERQILTALALELVQLSDTSEATIETTLVVLANAFADFLDFNDFIGVAESLLEDLDHHQQFQLASFHPHYQFADVAADDVGNYTNRAPWPIIQILRESSVSKAVDAGDTARIPERNIARMRALGEQQRRRLFPWVTDR